MEGMQESTADEKRLKNAVKENNLEMAYLHMSVESAKATGCLAKACDDECPKGLAHVVWKNQYMQRLTYCRLQN